MFLQQASYTPSFGGLGLRQPDSVATESEVPVRVIEPKTGWRPVDFGEVWEYRDLFYFLMWRNIKTRYAQTVFGLWWAVFKPFVSMIVLTVVFGSLVGVSSDGAPYPVFLYAGMLPWSFFSGATGAAMNSLNKSKNFLTKVYIPRLVMPLHAVMGRLFDFGLALLLLGVLMVWFRQVPTFWVVLLPLLVVLAMVTAAGIGMAVAAFAIQYRDIKTVAGSLMGLMMYGSPVVYPVSLVPDQYRLLYGLNPMAGVIEGFRSALLGTNPMPWDLLGMGMITVTIIVVSGTFLFRRMEHNFADVV